MVHPDIYITLGILTLGAPTDYRKGSRKPELMANKRLVTGTLLPARCCRARCKAHLTQRTLTSPKRTRMPKGRVRTACASAFADGARRRQIEFNDRRAFAVKRSYRTLFPTNYPVVARIGAGP